MQVLIVFVLLFSLWTISSAADVTVYDVLEYALRKPGHEPKPLAVSQFPLKFSYNHSDGFFIFWKNMSPNVTINVTTDTDYGLPFGYINNTITTGPSKGEEHCIAVVMGIRTEMKINIYRYPSNILCAQLLVAEGKDAATIPNEMKAQYYDITNQSLYYALVVDLIHQCEDPPSVTGTTMTTTTENTVTTAETIIPSNNTITSNNTSSTDLEITSNKNSSIDTRL